MKRNFFVIFRARVDHERAVDLLAQHDAHELVREGHTRKGNKPVRRPLDAGRKPARRADDKGDLLAAVAQRFQRLRKALGRVFPALDGERENPPLTGAENGFGFLFGRFPLGKFLHFKFAEAGEPLGVFRDGVPPERLFEFSHTDERYLNHP